ncbi:MAG: hypothetical protein ACLSE8_15525 [Parasutterella sp.]
MREKKNNNRKKLQKLQPEPANNNPEANDSDKLGLNIIKAILADVCDVSRIYLRPSKTYCAVLLDDNNRKTLVRFYFQNPEKLKIDLYGFMRA